LPVNTALIDGELVRLEPDGTTSFAGLQNAISNGNTAALTFFAFDLLYRDGWDLSGAALEDRKAALAEIIPRNAQGMLRYSDHQIDQGPAFLRQARSYGLEGIISKRRTEPYRPGRSASRLKVKCRNREEFVVVGFTDPERSRQGFGALLLGYYDPERALHYAGRVGTGFSTAQLVELRRQLDDLERAEPAVALPRGVSSRGVHWVESRLVAQVEFATWTADGILRQASFQGLREDKSAREVVIDPQSRTAAPQAAQPRKVAARSRQTAAQAADTSGPQRGRDGSLKFEGVRLTHPDHILYPGTALTKLDIARYYAAVAKWALPHLSHRLLTLVRSPAVGRKTFYQKHIGPEAPDTIRRFEFDDGEGSKIYPYIEDLPGLVALVQMDVVEIHPWGSTIKQLDDPDRVTFDLDADEGLPWQRITEAALRLREALLAIGLKSFAKTTGGKGLHVVVPLAPKLGWDEIRVFAKWVADSFVAQRPEDFTANMAKTARHGRIYIDYLRNGQQSALILPVPVRALRSRHRCCGTRSKLGFTPTASRLTPSRSGWVDLAQIRGRILAESASHSVHRSAAASGFDDGAVAMWVTLRSRPGRDAPIAETQCALRPTECLSDSGYEAPGGPEQTLFHGVSRSRAGSGGQVLAPRTCEQLDHRAVKSRNIIRLAAGDQITVDDCFLIDDIRSGVLQIGSDRRPRGHASASHLLGLDNCSRPVTDRRHRFACVEECPHERNGSRNYSQLVRIDHTARKQQCVEVLRPSFFELQIDWKRLAPVRKVPAAHLVAVGRDDPRVGPGLIERFARFGQFHFFKTIRD
jgi:DNA ligase D